MNWACGAWRPWTMATRTTMGLAMAFGDAFRALGGEVPVAGRIEKGDTDMTNVLVDFAEADPDSIFFPLFFDEGSPFAEQVQAFDGLEDATLITDSALKISEFLGMPHSEGIYFAAPEDVHGLEMNSATGKSADDVLAVLESRLSPPAEIYWAQSYDATVLLLSAIKAVAVAEGGKLYIDRAMLREELGTTTGFQGIAGELSCDEFGDCGSGRMTISYHTDSRITDPAQVPVVYHFAP